MRLPRLSALLLLTLAACGGANESIATTDDAITFHPPPICGQQGGAACTSGEPCLQNLVDIGGTCEPCASLHLNVNLQQLSPERIEVAWSEVGRNPVTIWLQPQNSPHPASLPVTVTPNGGGIGQWTFENTWPSTDYKAFVKPANSTCAAWSNDITTSMDTVYIGTSWLTVTNAQGWGSVTFHSDGTYTWEGQLEDTGGLNEDVSISVLIPWVDPVTHKALAFSRSASLTGSSYLGQTRTTWSIQGSYADIATNWLDFRKAIAHVSGRNWELQMTSSLADILTSLGSLATSLGIIGVVGILTL
jgi:hypothetical protein